MLKPTTVLAVVLLVGSLFAGEFKPAEVALKSGTNITGLVLDVEGQDVQVFNGAFTSNYPRADVVSVTFVDGEKAQAIQDEVRLRQERRPRVTVEKPERPTVREEAKKPVDEIDALRKKVDAAREKMIRAREDLDDAKAEAAGLRSTQNAVQRDSFATDSRSDRAQLQHQQMAISQSLGVAERKVARLDKEYQTARERHIEIVQRLSVLDPSYNAQKKDPRKDMGPTLNEMILQKLYRERELYLP